MALILTSFTMSGGMFDPHQKLLEALDNIERSVRFSQDETVLRNRIVRIVLDGEADPNNLTVEYGPDKDFILPSAAFNEALALDTYSEDELEEKLKEVNSKFNKVMEFQEEPLEFDDDVKVIAVGTTLTNNLNMGGKSSIFFYPSGEKDGAFIVLANDEEFATLSIEPFTLDFKRSFYTIEGTTIDEDFFADKAEEFYKEWLSWND